jgi:integral membrane protein
MPDVTASTPAPGRLAGSLTRYRVMAWVTGGFLLLLTLEMAVKYGLNHGQPWLGNWIAITHGWIYVVYLITVVDMWSKLRWGPNRLLMLVLAGVVPGLSFVAEHRVTGEARERIAYLEAARGSGTTLAR